MRRLTITLKPDPVIGADPLPSRAARARQSISGLVQPFRRSFTASVPGADGRLARARKSVTLAFGTLADVPSALRPKQTRRKERPQKNAPTAKEVRATLSLAFVFLLIFLIFYALREM